MSGPGITFDVLVLLFGAFAFVDGILLFGFGLLAAGEHDQWWPLVLSGILGVVVGVLTLFQPAAVALGLVFVIGIWAVVTGLLEIVAAVRLRKLITTEWLMAFTGVVSIIFGVLVLAQPASGALALVYLFGFYAVLVGVLQISFGLRLRRAHERCPHSNATRGNIEVNLQVDGVGVNAPQTRHIRQVELRQ